MSKISVKPQFAGKQIIYEGKPVVLSTNPTARDLAVYQTMVKKGYGAYFDGIEGIKQVAPFAITKLNNRPSDARPIANNNSAKSSANVDYNLPADELIKQAQAAYLLEADLMTVSAKSLKVLNAALGIAPKSSITQTFKALSSYVSH